MYWPIRFGRAPALAANDCTGASESGAPGAWTPRNFPPAGSRSPDTSYGRLPGTRVGVDAGDSAPGTPYRADDPQAASAAVSATPPSILSFSHVTAAMPPAGRRPEAR